MKKEEAIEWLEVMKETAIFEQYEALKMAIEALLERTGEWVWSDEDMSWKCSNCGCVFEEIDWKPEYNFCPNCRARMIGGDSE